MKKRLIDRKMRYYLDMSLKEKKNEAVLLEFCIFFIIFAIILLFVPLYMSDLVILIILYMICIAWFTFWIKILIIEYKFDRIDYFIGSILFSIIVAPIFYFAEFKPFLNGKKSLSEMLDRGNKLTKYELRKLGKEEKEDDSNFMSMFKWLGIIVLILVIVYLVWRYIIS